MVGYQAGDQKPSKFIWQAGKPELTGEVLVENQGRRRITSGAPRSERGKFGRFRCIRGVGDERFYI